MHSTGQPDSQSCVGYVVQFCSFSHWHLIFYTLNVGICQCIMGLHFWVSEFCSGADFVEVLPIKTSKETHTKKTPLKCALFEDPKLQKNNITIAWPNNCVTFPRDFHSC